MWHSCVVVSVDEHLARVPPPIQDLYRRFERLVLSTGPGIEVVPVKTRIALMVRMRFAGCVLQQRAIRIGLILPRRMDSSRIVRHETYGRPTPVGHYLKVQASSELDDELAGWVAEAYELGCQRG
jgi:hypothetical protein